MNSKDKTPSPEDLGEEYLKTITEDSDKEEKRLDQLERIDSKARMLLKDEAFFYKLGFPFYHGINVKKLNKPRFIVGEERNKRLIIPLLIGASKLKMTSLVKIEGEVGTAKDSMVRIALELTRNALDSIERNFMSASALKYSDNVKNTDLLYIPDSPAFRGEMGHTLRFMRSDDGGLIGEVTVRDKDSRDFTTKTHKLDVKGVITTSNYVTSDRALSSGMWTLKTNDSPKLTKAVTKAILKFRSGKRTIFPLEELKVWHRAFEILLSEDLIENPIIPYAEKLITLLESQSTESRRNPDKLCDLISLIAWFRRFQKPKDKRNKADFIDLYIALQIGLDAITQTIQDLNNKEKLILDTVRKNEKIEKVTCPFIAKKTSIPYKTCYRFLEALIEKGWLLKDKIGNRNIYMSFSEKKVNSFLIDGDRTFDSPELLIKSILNSVGDFSTSQKRKTSIIEPLSGNEVIITNTTIDNTTNISIKVLERSYPSPYKKEPQIKLSLPISSEKLRSVKRSSERVLESEKKTILKISNGMRRGLERFQ